MGWVGLGWVEGDLLPVQWSVSRHLNLAQIAGLDWELMGKLWSGHGRARSHEGEEEVGGKRQETRDMRQETGYQERRNKVLLYSTLLYSQSQWLELDYFPYATTSYWRTPRGNREILLMVLIITIAIPIKSRCPGPTMGAIARPILRGSKAAAAEQRPGLALALASWQLAGGRAANNAHGAAADPRSTPMDNTDKPSALAPGPRSGDDWRPQDHTHDPGTDDRSWREQRCGGGGGCGGGGPKYGEGREDLTYSS
ncbi:uncharacterized protein BP5553_10422 [Venustampulla echinocandica]|uniref:Uncharacterized protein n=1 Tax=Venustampulla echinocandica TaxID=2656787 RepID=A0A370T999_9HELO|nr:uncharacterized protein BP5553_10422 [Venustampulla echinocandica]RDL30144.1 hypothetical protein BP5553_10422 [Venustampulla echinocandica]